MPVTIDTSLPLHDNREATWDGDAARNAMAASCGGRGETLDASCMGEGFLFRDPDADETTLGAYKLPVANIFDGSKRLVWSGVTSAAGYLDSTSGMSDADKDRARGALSTIYGRFRELWDDDSIQPPWESQTAAAKPDTETVDKADGEVCSCCSDAERTVTGEDGYDPVIRASAADGSVWAPPREWFQAGEPAPLTVTAEGRVYGDLARFGQLHIGASGEKVYPPKDPDGLYRAFRQRTIVTAEGDKLAVGVLTMDTGHAGMGIGSQAAVEHYDHTGAIVAAITVGEDSDGPDGKGRIWLAGALLPDVTDKQRLRLMLSGVSGDWRQIRPRGPLELVAALAVNVPGFPVPAKEIGHGQELAVVAAGAVLPQSTGNGEAADLSDEVIDRVANRVVDVTEERAAAKACVEAETVRLKRARVANAVMASCVRRERARNAQSAITAALLANVDFGDDDDGLVAQAGRSGRGGRFLDSRGRNWVTRTGGLPRTIRRVANELMRKGFTESHAIATAVKVVKQWCSGSPDGLNFPGIQRVTPRTRARGCVATTEWHLNRARARAMRSSASTMAQIGEA